MEYQIDIWQDGERGVMHLEMFERRTRKTMVHIRQGMRKAMTLEDIACELRSLAEWVDLQGK